MRPAPRRDLVVGVRFFLAVFFFDLTPALVLGLLLLFVPADFEPTLFEPVLAALGLPVADFFLAAADFFFFEPLN